MGRKWKHFYQVEPTWYIWYGSKENLRREDIGVPTPPPRAETFTELLLKASLCHMKTSKIQRGSKMA